MNTSLTRESLEAIYRAKEAEIIGRWKEFLRIPSVSADPAYNGDCRTCAEWLSAYLTGIGLKTEIIESSTKPIVFGTYEGRKGAPIVLYYGHYDVQPPDPLGEWQSKPFEPEQRGDRLYARGAIDNKGQSMYFFEALRTLIERRALHCTVKVVMEGEEESGSGGLYEVLEKITGRVQSDVLMVCDTEVQNPAIPEITMGLKGIVHLTARLTGAKFDLHSGLQGGVAPNPATQLARLIATLHDESGRIAVRGFYDDVIEFTREERVMLNASPFDPQAYFAELGVMPTGGEAESYTPQERRGIRPTVEINGIHSGYGGPGHKTIIPAVAEAKITSRIVRGQNPHRVLQCIIDHLVAHTPNGLKLEITEANVGGEALALDTCSPLVARARAVLTRACGTPPVMSWIGGSLPIVARLAAVSQSEPLLVGFGTREDRMHGPNESFSLTQFRKGFVYCAMMLEELGASLP